MPTRNIVLTDHQSTFVNRMVEGGQYQNASEVLRDALRRMERDEDEWERAKAGVLEGLAQIERGETVDGEEAFRRVLEKVGRAE
jgi:antitoxin ParD1/3/4